ncbi:MAG: glycyl-radical enzyme activating protein [Clostridia bacterium]|nr:glycyl-radical enzyme activating protein [Clostridia bacterium]
MENVLISNLQRFSTKDGPGIRTTVFFKGCPLRCKWCHNPETHLASMEIMYNRENCTLCGRCVVACPEGAITIENNTVITDTDKCTSCHKCTEECYYNAREISGKALTFDEICDVLERDIPFYSESGGGVTFSGGECLMFPEMLTRLLKFCKARRIHTAVDTSGFAAWEVFQKILPYTDLFLYDIKAFSSSLHKEITGVENTLIWENLEKLSKIGANVNLRLPVIEGCNGDLADIEETARCSAEFGIKKVNILPYHDMGKYKYTKLGRDYDSNSMSTPSDEKLEEIKRIFAKYLFTDIKIGG